jgi:hypothetical protein
MVPRPEAVEDGVAVLDDVVVGPEVEREAHRLPVLSPEQRFDVGVEADRLVRTGQRDRLVDVGVGVVLRCKGRLS